MIQHRVKLLTECFPANSKGFYCASGPSLTLPGPSFITGHLVQNISMFYPNI